MELFESSTHGNYNRHMHSNESLLPVGEAMETTSNGAIRSCMQS